MAYRLTTAWAAALAACAFLTGLTKGADSGGEVGPEGVVLQPAAWPIYADTPANESGATPPNATPAYAPAPSNAEQRPLMAALHPTPVGQALEQARINIFGYMEGSYQYNFMHPNPPVTLPRTPLNPGRLLDVFQHDRVYLNQLNLAIERKVDLTTHQFDIGGRVEGIFGQDARFIHANGLLDHQQGSNPNVSPPIVGGEWQFDLYQAYFDVGVPLGNGVRVRAGKFSFFKPIDPNASIFYTHTIAYAATFPYTNTGVTVMYPFSDAIRVEGGISRGWDQALKDNNGAIDGLARVIWTPTETTRLIGSVIFGPELYRNNHDYTTLVDITLTQAVGEKLTLYLDAVFGNQVHAVPGNIPGAFFSSSTATPLGGANWYGVSGDALYSVNTYLDVALRLEWFRDEEGFTTNPFPPGGQNLYEATVGASIYPLAGTALGRNFMLRPEVRYDYASKRYFDPVAFPGVPNAAVGSRHDQLTFAIDAVFNY
ncbi:MAG TPA: outer membrane beta-barrel protein [Tepidisphaeraceae bacterium]